MINALKEEFPNATLLVGPGNQIGLYSCGDGLIKDGITEVCLFPTSEKVYLMNRK